MALSSGELRNLIDHALHKPKNLATEAELIEYANSAILAFQSADVDSSDSLRIPELKNLCSDMGLPMENDEEEALMKIDADDSGQISIEEWISWWLKRVSCLPNPLRQQEAMAKNTFKKFDVDDSGSLEASELQELISSLGAKFTPEEMKEVIKQLDTDGSGIIELDEFTDWWVQRSAKSRSSGGLIAMKLRKLARKAAQVFFTDIFTAVWNNNINLVRTFLESDRRIGSASDVSEYGDGWMPLHYACYRGYVEIVNELLLIKERDNVNINATNDLGFSALFYAAQFNHIEICKILLEKGADPAVSGSAPDGSLFMCPVDHAQDNPDLMRIFKSHKNCVPPGQPPADKIKSSIIENKGLLSIELPPLKSFSTLPIKKWHIIVSTLSYSSVSTGAFEAFANGLDPNKSRGNNEITIQIPIDRKWLNLKALPDGSLPDLTVKIAGINSLNDKSDFSDDVHVFLNTSMARNMSGGVLVSLSRGDTGGGGGGPDTIDAYENDFNDGEGRDGEGKDGYHEEEEEVKDEEIERLRREIKGEDNEDDLGDFSVN